MFAKKMLFFILGTVFTMAILCFCPGCESAGGGEASPSPFTYPTEDTSLVTQPPSPTAVPTATAVPVTKEPLTEDQIGKILPEATVIYDEDFKDNYHLDETLIVNAKNYTIENEMITFGLDQWYGLNPDVYCEVNGENRQFEFHIDISTQYSANGTPSADSSPTFMGCFIGVYVDDINQNIIPTGDSGYWIALSHSREILVYPSGGATEGYWPGGAFKVRLDDGFIDMKHLAIVDTGNQLFYYIVDKDGNEKLFLRVEITSSDIKSFDKDGNLLNTSPNYLADTSGYMKIFNHYGETVIDRITIKAM